MASSTRPWARSSLGEVEAVSAAAAWNCSVRNTSRKKTRPNGNAASLMRLGNDLDDSAIEQGLYVVGGERDLRAFIQSGGNFDAGKILQRDGDRLLFQAVAVDTVDVGFAVIGVNRVALQSKHVFVLRDDNSDANVDIRQQAQVVVVDDAGGLADIAIVARLHR